MRNRHKVTPAHGLVNQWDAAPNALLLKSRSKLAVARDTILADMATCHDQPPPFPLTVTVHVRIFCASA